MEQTQEFKQATKEIAKIIRANHFSYEQVKYIFSQARKECELKAKPSAKGIKDHLSQEEAQKLINFAYSTQSNMGLLIKCLLFTGMRVNEFVNIKVEDVHLLEKKIYVREAKGNKPRYVPIFGFYIHELMTYVGERKEGYLFETRLNDKYTTRRIQQIIKGFAHDVGITKKITPHRLRATIATWLYDKGMSKDDIQLFLGHERPETTQIYIRGSVKNIGDIGDKLLLENK